jgi:hypothetical protein
VLVGFVGRSKNRHHCGPSTLGSTKRDGVEAQDAPSTISPPSHGAQPIRDISVLEAVLLNF